MSYRKRHNQGYLLGIVFSLVVLLFLFLPFSQIFVKNGPMLPGHENLECFSCHQDEQGSFRQQLQANIQYLLNNRKEIVSVGLRPVEIQNVSSVTIVRMIAIRSIVFENQNIERQEKISRPILVLLATWNIRVNV